MVARDDLIEFLRNNAPAAEFTPYCYRCEEADALTVYFENVEDYSKRLNDHITLYLSLKDNHIVGCRVKGIAWILDNLPNYIRVSHEGVELSLVFFAFTGTADDEDREALNALADEAKKRNIILEPA